MVKKNCYCTRYFSAVYVCVDSFWVMLVGFAFAFTERKCSLKFFLDLWQTLLMHMFSYEHNNLLPYNPFLGRVFLWSGRCPSGPLVYTPTHHTPLYKMTNKCKNITLPWTSFAAVKTTMTGPYETNPQVPIIPVCMTHKLSPNKIQMQETVDMVFWTLMNKDGPVCRSQSLELTPGLQRNL